MLVSKTLSIKTYWDVSHNFRLRRIYLSTLEDKRLAETLGLTKWYLSRLLEKLAKCHSQNLLMMDPQILQSQKSLLVQSKTRKCNSCSWLSNMPHKIPWYIYTHHGIFLKIKRKYLFETNTKRIRKNGYDRGFWMDNGFLQIDNTTYRSLHIFTNYLVLYCTSIPSTVSLYPNWTYSLVRVSSGQFGVWGWKSGGPSLRID